MNSSHLLYLLLPVTGLLLSELRTTGLVAFDELNPTVLLDLMASDAMWSYSTWSEALFLLSPLFQIERILVEILYAYS